MQSHHISRTPITVETLRTVLALAAIASTSSAQVGVTGKAEIQPLIPNAVLHEVLFDPIGTDGSAGNSEWIELYTSRSVNLDGWSLRDNQGLVLHTFGSLTMPAYGTVLVLFSDDVLFPFDTDPSDGQVAVALGLPAGDYLGNSSGGVRLQKPNGMLVDSLYWGTGGAPSGAPRGQWFDLALAGGRPMAEGDSLGRPANPYTTYTGKVGDWNRNGGRNAIRATPGGRNGVDLYNFAGMLTETQTGIVDMLIGFSDQVETGRISVTGAGVGNTAVASSSSSKSVIADHTFNLLDRGMPAVLSGSASATYTFDETPGSVAYSLVISGSLTSTSGFSVDVDYSFESGGAHTNSPSRHTETDFTWYESGKSYPYSIVADTSCTRTGQDTWRVDSSRTSVDFGGAGTKTSDSVTTETRLSDGVYQVVFDLVRSDPIQMPPLWDAGNQVVTGTEVSGMTHTQTMASNGDCQGSITRFDTSIDGQLIRTLDPGQLGSFSVGIDTANSTATSVARAYDLTLPVLMFGSPITLGMQVDALDSIVAGKQISYATRSVSLGTYTLLNDTSMVDPPLAAMRVRPAAFRQELGSPETGPDYGPKQDTAPKDAVTTCALSGALVGALIGGAAGAAAALPPPPPIGFCCTPPAAGWLLYRDGWCYLGWLTDY